MLVTKLQTSVSIYLTGNISFPIDRRKKTGIKYPGGHAKIKEILGGKIVSDNFRKDNRVPDHIDILIFTIAVPRFPPPISAIFFFIRVD